MMLFMVSSTSVFAGATISGTISYGTKSYPITGALTYSSTSSSKVLKATTTCNYSDATYSTKVKGRFKKGDKILDWQSSSGSKSAKISASNATGYNNATGDHVAYYANKKWTGGTDI